MELASKGAKAMGFGCQTGSYGIRRSMNEVWMSCTAAFARRRGSRMMVKDGMDGDGDAGKSGGEMTERSGKNSAWR